MGYQWDTNVFQEDEAFDPLADYSLVIEPAITATLPFRKSFFEAQYRATWFEYGTAFEDDEVAQYAGLRLNLLFSSLNRLEFAATKTFGVAKVEDFDPGGEVRYQGDSYDLDDYTVELSKDVQGHRGYRARAGWTAFQFDPNSVTNFFDYEGWSADLEYREPFGPQVWGVIAYTGSGFDHFCRDTDPNGNPCPGPDEPFRHENADTLAIGARGSLAGDQPFHLRVGQSRFRYTPESFRDFQGLTVDGGMGIAIGGGSSLRFGVARRPFPSFYFNNEYYLVDRFDVQFEHRWRNESSMGARVSYSTSDYPNRIVAPGDVADGQVREDRHGRAELYGTVWLVRRFGLSLSAAYQSRESNIEFQSFDAATYFAGVTYGFP
jgi:hypothetical protein